MCFILHILYYIYIQDAGERRARAFRRGHSGESISAQRAAPEGFEQEQLV